jgi:hypothetical protein
MAVGRAASISDGMWLRVTVVQASGLWSVSFPVKATVRN